MNLWIYGDLITSGGQIQWRESPTALWQLVILKTTCHFENSGCRPNCCKPLGTRLHCSAKTTWTRWRNGRRNMQCFLQSRHVPPTTLEFWTKLICISIIYQSMYIYIYIHKNRQRSYKTLQHLLGLVNLSQFLWIANVQASMDYKWINDRFQKGKAAIQDHMSERMVFLRTSSLVLAHTDVVALQAKLGTEGFLDWNYVSVKNIE